MNAVISFDTLKYANRLKQASVPPEQAEIQAEVMREMMEAVLQTAQLATKTDIDLLRKDTQTEFVRVRQEMQAELVQVRAEIALLRRDMEAQGNKLIIRVTIVFVAVLGALEVVSRFWSHAT